MKLCVAYSFSDINSAVSNVNEAMHKHSFIEFVHGHSSLAKLCVVHSLNDVNSPDSDVNREAYGANAGSFAKQQATYVQQGIHLWAGRPLISIFTSRASRNDKEHKA